MDAILDMVFIMDDEQYKRLQKFADQVAQVAIIDEIAKYELGMLSGYYVIQLSVMSGLRDKKEIIRFLSAGLHYICFRVEGSPYIYFKNEGDITDLWFDFYEKAEDKTFLKDMMTIQERYEMVFESNCYWAKHTPLSLMYTDDLDEDTVITELNHYTTELFVPENELVIIHEFSGEAHNVDLTVGIPDDYFVITVPKTLDKNDQKIL